MSILVKAFKKKCVWFDKLNFMNGDIAYTNKHVMVLRGEAHEVIHCALERKPKWLLPKEVSAKQSVPRSVDIHVRPAIYLEFHP